MMHAAPSARFDRGWIIVAVLFLCVGTLMGASIYGFIMVADIMARAHGWSESEAGGIVSAMWLVAPLALLSAPVIKRFGPWKLIIGGLMILAVAFACLTFATEFWQVYGLRILMGFGKVAIMTSVPVVVARWFDLRFGTAISIVWAGGSAGGIVFAPLVEYLNRTAGFQTTALTLAGGIAAVAAMAVFAARLRRPGGDLGSDGAGEDNAGAAQDDVAGPSAQRPASWPLVAGIIVATIGLGCANVAFLAMNPQILADFGIDTRTVALIVGFNAAASMVGALLIGWLTDRFGLGWPVLGMTAIYFGGIFAYLFLTHSPLASVALLGTTCIGLGAAAAEVLWISLLKREASGSRFAMIYGVWYFAIQVGYAVGGFAGGSILGNLGIAAFILFAAVTYAATPLFSAWRLLGRSGGSAPAATAAR